MRALAHRYLTLDQRRRLMLRWLRLTAWPPIGHVRFGSLRRGTPISRHFGYDRGTPIDRHYIDHFFRRHAGAGEYAPSLITGRVLEVGEDRYASQFGRPEHLDVLDVSENNAAATLIGDLTKPETLPESAYDCVIATQTLIVIYDLHAAVRGLHRLLKPGGTVLVTLPGVCQICRPDMDLWGDYWRFTSLSARRLFEEVFDPADVTVDAYGNVLSAASFLYGLAAQDLRERELDLRDPDYEVTIGVRATKR